LKLIAFFIYNTETISHVTICCSYFSNLCCFYDVKKKNDSIKVLGSKQDICVWTWCVSCCMR